MDVLPDVAGFREAQKRLRQRLGVDVVFLVPQAPTWPDGTQLDPETGRPYDPFAEPASGGDDQEVTVRCSLVNRALTPLDPTVTTAVGDQDIAEAALIVDEADFATVQGARRCRVLARTWRIAELKLDELAGDARYIAYLEPA